MTERHCRERGYGSVATLVSQELREDLAGLESSPLGAHADAVILGDLGDGFTPEILNGAFRALRGCPSNCVGVSRVDGLRSGF